MKPRAFRPGRKAEPSPDGGIHRLPVRVPSCCTGCVLRHSNMLETTVCTWHPPTWICAGLLAGNDAGLRLPGSIREVLLRSPSGAFAFEMGASKFGTDRPRAVSGGPSAVRAGVGYGGTGAV